MGMISSLSTTTRMLITAEPMTIGAMVGPEAFTEVKYLMHAKQLQALDAIPGIAAAFTEVFDREAGGLVRSYRADDAETIVVALGSVLGTIEDVIDHHASVPFQCIGYGLARCVGRQMFDRHD